MSFAPNHEALLVALVLAPATFSRNRHFSLYSDAALRKVHRRALVVRGIVRHLGETLSERKAQIVHVEDRPDGGVELRYEVPSLGLRRVAWLSAVEAAVVRFALERAGRQTHELFAHAAALDPVRIEATLSTLTRTLPDNVAVGAS